MPELCERVAGPRFGSSCDRGQRLDLELAAEMRVRPATVRELLAELAAAGEVAMCQLTRCEGSKTIEAWQCWVSGFVPAPAPARKPNAA